MGDHTASMPANRVSAPCRFSWPQPLHKIVYMDSGMNRDHMSKTPLCVEQS